MKKNFDNFKMFYLSFLGKAVSNILSHKILNLWKPINNSRIAAIGFCFPYLRSINKKTQRTFFLVPIGHGLHHFDVNNKNLTVSVNEYILPIDDLSLDRLLVIHSFEYLTDHNKFLREAWRSLDKNGEILIIVPNSFGLWRPYYKNNLSSLRTFSFSELNSLLLNNFFTPINFSNSLFFPPINNQLILDRANIFEKASKSFLKFFSGVIIVRARKNYSTAILKEKKIIKRKVMQKIRS
jgi:SAM-dependent methyltransferase